ncbi:MAG: hypothetical protein HYZ81_12970 [Nitrospinae bacterium]|nr:hypothetical protein [Nitrospinota bacterium]
MKRVANVIALTLGLLLVLSAVPVQSGMMGPGQMGQGNMGMMGGGLGEQPQNPTQTAGVPHS